MGMILPAAHSQENPSAVITSDLDGNGIVNAFDLYLFSTLWKTTGNTADFNGDGIVDVLDLLAFVVSFQPISETTPTPTPTQSIDTPTPSSTPESATPTPTLETSTPSATPESATPTPTIETSTPTPTSEEGTPTPTSIIIEPTPTPTAPDETPTPEEGTPTPTITPTNTPEGTPGEDTPTSTPTPEATPTPTIDLSASPTPTPEGLLFYTNFDTSQSLDEAGMETLEGVDAEEQLIDEDRMPVLNTLFPWFVLNTEELSSTDYGVALSDPKSAAINENHYAYQSSQTSVLQIKNTLDTSQAVDPVLTFEAAFLFEPPYGFIRDFVVVEVKRGNSDTWELLDINGDNVVTDDDTAYDEDDPQPLLPGTFDGLFGASNPDNTVGPLTQNDFVSIAAHLPIDATLSIAFRFESDSAITAEGIYLDNIRVYDASSGSGFVPTIRRVINQEGTTLYADTENRVTIQGSNLTPVQKILFTSSDGVSELTFQETSEGITAMIPRLSNPNQDDSASIQVVRSDGATSVAFALSMKAAPSPVIDSIYPSPFYIGSASSTITITGSDFRPAFSGATESDGSRVIIDTGSGDPIQYVLPSEFISRTRTVIVIDGTALKSLDPGTVTVKVKNDYSGLESNSVNLILQSGTGELEVDGFTIEVGSGVYSYDPATEQFPLQFDQSFTLVWDIFGASSDQLNIRVAGIPIVASGAVNTSIITERFAQLGIEVENPETKVSLNAGTFGVTLEVAPLVFGVTGSIPVEISQGEGSPVETSFALFDPQPPALYEKSGDWASQEWSISDEIAFTVYGDNFRGLYTFGTDAESVTQLQLIPVDGGDPISLPAMTIFDVFIVPYTGDPDYTDSLYQLIPTSFYKTEEGQKLVVNEGETKTFRLRVLNPDSGLYVDSGERTLTLIP